MAIVDASCFTFALHMDNALKRIIRDKTYDSEPLGRELKAFGIEMGGALQIEVEAAQNPRCAASVAIPQPMEDRAAFCLASKLPRHT